MNYRRDTTVKQTVSTASGDPLVTGEKDLILFHTELRISASHDSVQSKQTRT
jgi:hypothetical protein